MKSMPISNSLKTKPDETAPIDSKSKGNIIIKPESLTSFKSKLIFLKFPWNVLIINLRRIHCS